MADKSCWEMSSINGTAGGEFLPNGHRGSYVMKYNGTQQFCNFCNFFNAMFKYNGSFIQLYWASQQQQNVVLYNGKIDTKVTFAS